MNSTVPTIPVGDPPTIPINVPTVPTIPKPISIPTVSTIPKPISIPTVSTVPKPISIPTVSTIPKPISIPTVSTVSQSINVPTISMVPTVPKPISVPTITTVSTVPTLPIISTVPKPINIPTVTTLPTISTVPKPINIPTVTTLPTISTVPKPINIPTVPTISTVPTPINIPTVPTISTVPTPINIPTVPTISTVPKPISVPTGITGIRVEGPSAPSVTTVPMSLKSAVIPISVPAVPAGPIVSTVPPLFTVPSIPVAKPADIKPLLPVPSKDISVSSLVPKIPEPILIIPILSVDVKKVPIEYHDPTKILTKVKVPKMYLDAPVAKIETEQVVFNEHHTPFYRFKVEDTYVTPTDPKKEYHSRKFSPKGSFGWGQRKLGLALIQFLTKYLSLNTSGNPSTVVYAGAAPGNNIHFASLLFPKVIFHLYDPRKFDIPESNKILIYDGDDSKIQGTHRIIIHTGDFGMFTDQEAQKWSQLQSQNKNIYFVSDIRSVDHDTDSKQEFELGVWKDMQSQKMWHQTIGPIKSQLKFRLPYDLGENSPIASLFPGGKIPYLGGIVYKGIYSKPTSTESRLVPDDEEVIYDFKDYESKMFYFNTEVKENRKFLNLITKGTDPVYPPNLLNDYNSMAETFVWIEYLQANGISITVESIIKLSNKLSKDLSVGSVEKSLAQLRSK